MKTELPISLVGLWLLCSWLTPAVATAQEEVQLEPIYAANMVLQSGARHIVRGRAPPRHYVSLTFHGGKPLRGQADKRGAWELVLDLERQTVSSVGELVVSCGPKKDQLEPALVLTNVAVGEVWLLGVVNNQGVAAQNPESPDRLQQIRRHLASFRFATISPLPAATNLLLNQNYPWHALAPDSENLAEVRSLAYCWAQALGSERFLQETYVGIIQTRTNDLTRLLRPSDRPESWSKARQANQVKLGDTLSAAWDRTRLDVARKQRERYDLLVQAKHAGRVDKPDEVLDYDPPHVFLREAFHNRLEDWVPPFTGAIW